MECREDNVITLSTKKHWKNAILILLLLAPLVQLPFFCLISLFIIAIYKGVTLGITMIKHKATQKIVKGLNITFFILFISISLRLFVVDVYRVSGSSMENTLFPEDIILVNKIAYNSVLTSSLSELPWKNLSSVFHDVDSCSDLPKNFTCCNNLSKKGSIMQGDLLLYELRRMFFVVKRCVAVSGDILHIKEGEIYVNDKKYVEPPTAKASYHLEVMNEEKFYKQLDSLNLLELIRRIHETNDGLQGNISNTELEIIKNLYGVKEIKRNPNCLNLNNDLFTLPRDEEWNLENMGPVLIPKRSTTIPLNHFTYDVYKHVIDKHESVELVEKDDRYFLAGNEVFEYTFKQDYYFVIGDSRMDSIDSRHLGFLPENSVVGQVKLVLFSKYKQKFGWNRLSLGLSE